MGPQDPNVEVTHVSGLSRLYQSMVCALCISPLVLFASSGLVGWNEKHVVCSHRAIDAAQAVVQEVGCDTVGHEKLVQFSCDMKKEGLELDGNWENINYIREFLPLKYVGTGLDVVVEMLQCVEHESTKEEKDKMGGGGVTKTTTYSYSTEWREDEIDSTQFHGTGCSARNPGWPLGVPKSATVYAPSVKAGSFTLEGSFVHRIPLNTPVDVGSSLGPTWTKGLFGSYETDDYMAPGGHEDIGKMRVTFKGTDWSRPAVTVLGHETNGGHIKDWNAPSSWLCSGFTISEVRQGKVSQKTLFESMHAGANMAKWIFRIVGFILMWCAFSGFAAPLGVVADCIPCVGPYLGDAVENIACCVSCLPATACCMLIAGVVWVAMRPMIGIPMLLFCAAVFIGYAVFKANAQKKGALLDEGAE